MSDPSALIDHLEEVLEALERIPGRFEGIETPADFLAGKEGLNRMDAICMVLIAAGEAFKQIDRKTGGQLLSRYPQVEWRDVMAVRNVLAHGYFDVDTEALYAICKEDIPVLIATVRTILTDLKQS